jgi:electron transport complex protein RnfG
MAKLESSFKNMVLILTIITLFAALTLASVYTYTKEPIALSKIAKQQKAIQQVLPAGFDHLADPVTVEDGNESLVINKAYDKQNNFIGAAIQSSSSNGYSGKIVVMVGFDASGTIVDYAVLDQKETPGLGTKMVEWFKTDKGNQSIKGKNAETTNLTVKKDGGEIDAITAATISSRAFLFTIRNAYHAFSLNKDESNENTIKTDSVNSVNNN